jgi:hypothetical protein
MTNPGPNKHAAAIALAVPLPGDGATIATTAMEINPSSSSALAPDMEPQPVQSPTNIVIGLEDGLGDRSQDNRISVTIGDHGDERRQATHVRLPSCLIIHYFSLMLSDHA